MYPNTGHGHVYVRPDGIRARCGGPAICGECAKDFVRWTAEQMKKKDDFVHGKPCKANECKSRVYCDKLGMCSVVFEEIRLKSIAHMADKLKQRPDDQPLPVKNDHPFMHDLVKIDIEARKQIGIRRYGQALQPHNGRDGLRDVYEEILDAAAYMRQLIYERDGK